MADASRCLGRGILSLLIGCLAWPGPLIGRVLMQGNCIPAKRATKEDTGQAAQAQSQIDFLKVNL